MLRTPISRTGAVSALLLQLAPAWAEAYLGRVKYNSPPSSTLEEFGNYLAIHVGQAIDAQQVQHGGVRVVAVVLACVNRTTVVGMQFGHCDIILTRMVAARRLHKMTNNSQTKYRGDPDDDRQDSGPEAQAEILDPNDSNLLRDRIKGQTQEHARPPRLEDEGQSGG